MPQRSEVDHHDDADEGFEDEDELALGEEVRLAGLPDQLRHLEHGPVYRQPLELPVDAQAEDEAESADDQACVEQLAAGHPEEMDRVEVGQDELGLVGARGRSEQEREEGEGRAAEFILHGAVTPVFGAAEIRARAPSSKARRVSCFAP